MVTWLDLPWYENVKGWVRKRRKVILWTAAASGAGACIFCAVYWYRSRFRVRVKDEEVASRLAVAEKEAEDRLELELHHHFQSIQRISDSMTLPSAMAQTKDRLFLLVDLSPLTKMLLAGKDAPQAFSPQERLQLWNRLKILSFTQAISAIVGVTLLELFIRVQVNIVGRHMYFDQIRVFSSEAGSRGVREEYLSSTCQKRFLEFSEFLPHFGVDLLVEDIQAAVENIIGNISLKQRFDPSGLRGLFGAILSAFLDRHADCRKYVLPTDDFLPGSLHGGGLSSREVDDDDDDDEKFNRLMVETRMVLSSMEFRGILEGSLDIALAEAMIQCNTTFSESSASGVPLARLLLPVGSLAGSFLKHVDNNHFILALASEPRLQSFCAMVYSSSS